jgi:hypothetical protein
VNGNSSKYSRTESSNSSHGELRARRARWVLLLLPDDDYD